MRTIVSVSRGAFAWLALAAAIAWTTSGGLARVGPVIEPRNASRAAEARPVLPDQRVRLHRGESWAPLPCTRVYLGTDLAIPGEEPAWPLDVQLDPASWLPQGELLVTTDADVAGVKGAVQMVGNGEYVFTGPGALLGVEPAEDVEGVPSICVQLRDPDRIPPPPPNKRVALLSVRQLLGEERVQSDHVAFDYGVTTAWRERPRAPRRGIGRPPGPRVPSPPTTRPGPRQRDAEGPAEEALVADGEPAEVDTEEESRAAGRGAGGGTPPPSPVPAEGGGTFVATPLAVDTLRIEGNDDGDVAGILVHATEGMYCLEKTFYTDEVEALGDLSSSVGCGGSDLTVFSVDNAIHHVPDYDWGEDAREHSFTLSDPVEVYAVIWILAGDYAERAEVAKTDFHRANQLLTDSRCGVQLVLLLEPQDAVEIATENGWDASICEPALGDALFMPGMLNIYYCGDTEDRGYFCGNDTLFVSLTADNETLAHEVGHALSLEHVNTVDEDGDGVTDFPSTNLMVSGGLKRGGVTCGQAFRTTLGIGSAIHHLSLYKGPTRNCQKDDCPSLGYDY